MQRYLAVSGKAFLRGLAWRVHVILTFITNTVYMIVIYYLWKSIFGANESLNGMSFEQAFVYLALASSCYILFETYTDWSISERILDGSLATLLVKPIDYQLYTLFDSLGQVLTNALLITLPSLAIVFLVFRMPAVVGINLLFVPISVALSFALSFSFDYIVGLSSFYTESIWGLVTVKKIVIGVFSGLMIPLAFFPEGMQRVLIVLPFHAIYHTPLSMITDASLGLADYLSMLGIQALWVLIFFVLGKLFYQQAVKAVTINGG